MEQLFGELLGSEGSRPGGWQGGKTLVDLLFMGFPMGQVALHVHVGDWDRVFVGGEVIVALTSHLKAVTFSFHPCQHTHLPWNLEQSSRECGYLGIFLVYSVLECVPMGTCTSVYSCVCMSVCLILFLY